MRRRLSTGEVAGEELRRRGGKTRGFGGDNVWPGAWEVRLMSY